MSELTDTPLFDRPAAVQDLRENRALRIQAPPAPPRDWNAVADEWVAENPKHWSGMCIMARRWCRTRGWVSFKALAEWFRGYVVTRKRGQWKFNNSITAPLARRFAREYPAYARFVEFRKSRSGPTPYQDARPCPGAKREG